MAWLLDIEHLLNEPVAHQAVVHKHSDMILFIAGGDLTKQFTIKISFEKAFKKEEGAEVLSVC